MLPEDWIPHRREDGELIGWIRESGDDWVAVDVLGRAASEPGDWMKTEEALEEIGLRFLADSWVLEGEAEVPLRVRFVEVTPSTTTDEGRIVVKVDDFGDMDRPATEQFVLPWPLPERLRPARPDDPDGRTLAR